MGMVVMPPAVRSVCMVAQNCRLNKSAGFAAVLRLHAWLTQVINNLFNRAETLLAA
jgi:hypothetical protein